MIGKTISHYKILSKLGSGGMSVVYRARDAKLERFGALKFLLEHLTDCDNVKFQFDDLSDKLIFHVVCVAYSI
jgi:serine/threonine protein kinase